jgi:hypothetical protein
VFEGKSPSCVAFLFRPGAGPPAAGSVAPGGQLLESPLLAVGCSDGVTRVLSLFPFRVRPRSAAVLLVAWVCFLQKLRADSSGSPSPPLAPPPSA